MQTNDITLPTSLLGWLIYGWGVGGFCLILLRPIVHLSELPLVVLPAGLTPGQWAFLVVWCGFMLYVEGYRGFYKRLAPRVVVRGLALAERRPLVPSLLAPFTCLGLLYGTRKRLIVSWSVTMAISCVIVGVRLLPDVWRAIVDVGVLLGLSVGLISVVGFAVRAVLGHLPDADPEMP
jgi:hypothetical protein